MNNTFSLSTYNITDSFDQYQRSVRDIPLLTLEEERELGLRLKNTNDLEAAKTLVLSHLKLVIKIARSFGGYGLPIPDLVQEGNIGLMKAVKKFDVDRGVRLVSYATLWIKAEIQEYVVKNWRLVKTATTKAHRKLFFNLRSLRKTLQTLNSNEIKSIANELNVKQEDVREMEYRFNGNEIAIDYSGEESEDDTYRPVSYLKDQSPGPLEQLEENEVSANSSNALKNALNKLDARSQEILQARWLKNDKAETLQDLAKRFNISAERIRQIEQNAMQKIKTLMLQNQ